MSSNRKILLAAAAAGLVTLTAAQRPGAFASASAGLWEISGGQASKPPVRQCVADLTSLARYEHRGKGCSARVISDNASSTVIEYNCGGAGFGRSRVDIVTPRNLRIETQGISEGLPFNYVLQARRIGDCPAKAAPDAH